MEKSLKTLKDLKFRSHLFPEILRREFPQMKEPITFKDDFFVNLGDLKQEAIKWVKVEKPKLHGIGINDNHKFTAEEVRMCIKDWIKHFFNLTEKDLKGGKKTNGTSTN